MRKTVHSKLICSYIFIGIVGFLFATAGGSHFVETYLEEEVGARLYDSAVRFASDAVTVQLSYRSILGHEGIEPTRVMITADLQSAPPP